MMFSRFRVAAVILCLAAMPVFGACDGKDGLTGPTGLAGEGGPAGPAGETGPAGEDGADGADGDTSILGFATVNTGDGPTGACVWLPGGDGLPCVYHVGGASTDSVTVTQQGVGSYLVAFHGSYGEFTDTGRHQVTILATATQGGGTYVAVASHTSDGSAFADGTKVTTRVQIWNTDTLSAADKDFSVLMLR